MALVLHVSTAYGTGIDKAVSELLHLATVTQCVIATDFEGLQLSVSPGQNVVELTRAVKERIARHDAFKSR